jgi:hypothetical protein
MDHVKFYTPRPLEAKKTIVTIRDTPKFKRDRIDGGDPVRTPVDRIAARVVSPAPWWAMPPTIKDSLKQTNKQTKKESKKMTTNEREMLCAGTVGVPGRNYISESGIRVVMVNGEPMMNADDFHRVLCDEIAKLPKETRPNVKAAEDARKIISELCEGIGGEMEKFKADSKNYLQDIRSARMSIVSETSAMSTSLREVRQFFLGSDYAEEIKRLREFVDLCERLNSLKESGFLDNVADTMLRLAK